MRDTVATPDQHSRLHPTLAVFGLGFVGLPLALSFSMRGARVIGVDVVKELVSELSKGITHHKEAYQQKPIQAILKEELEAGRFAATTDAEDALAQADALIVTVGIPVWGNEPNFDHLTGVCQTIAKGLRPGMTIIIRSTVVPGTTENLLRPILESTGLRAGEDFYLAYASERIAEGRAFHEFESLPCLVAGINEISTQRAMEVLGVVTKAQLVAGSSIRAVELTKVIENVQRDVNIAMIQEFARLAERLDIDIFEVIKMANTHPRVKLLEPGPGVGGYCIPNALHYLVPKAKELAVNLEIAAAARRINDGMPGFVVDLIAQAAGPITASKVPVVGVIGLAMKDNSNDDRLSPAIRVVDLLLQRGYVVQAYDPAVPTNYEYKVDSLEACVTGADAVVVLARQQGVTPEAILSALAAAGQPVGLVDTRNLFPASTAFPKNVSLTKL
ncbi:MAG TPA: nucleotide sugar dehydrogenase [Symbiobacteriaceae bacterium]|nr:nucleotide sugar dehydrogenase [Symbiobacteriaceae bacterium]